MAKHNQLGSAGELAARTLLQSKGYEILESNFRIGHLEIDLIAENNGILVIVEVKTRSNRNFQSPEQAVNLTKIKRLVLAANGYIKLHNWKGETRFDIISITPNQNGFDLEHIINAFYVPVNF